jgi:hypothetical protein
VKNSTNGATHQPDEDLVRSYVAARLSADEAERFEEHFFACDACWREVETANELREALQRSGSARTIIPSRRWWVGGLAAAAMAAFVFIGVRQYTEQRQPVFRGGEQALQTSLKTTGSGIVIEWPAVPEAQSYAVVFLSADATPVTRQQIREPRIEVSPETASRASHYRVQALDSFERVLADSDLQRIR